MDPGPFFYTDKTIYCKHLFCLLTASIILFISLQTNISFHTIRLILCFQQNQWDWQPHCKLGQSILVVLCAGSTLLLTPVVRPATSQLATPSEVISFSYWSIKPWFLTEGKLATVLIIPSFWGSPTVCSELIKLFFWRRCRGERGFLQGESLISNLFTLLLFCLVYFTLSCLLCYIQNTKKLVSIIAFISVALF